MVGYGRFGSLTSTISNGIKELKKVFSIVLSILISETKQSKVVEKPKGKRNVKVKLGWLTRRSNDTQSDNPQTDAESDTLLQAAFLEDIPVGGFISDTELDAEFEYEDLSTLEEITEPSTSDTKPVHEQEALQVLDSQLLLITEGPNLVLHDPSRFTTGEDTELVRRRLSSDHIEHLYFWLLDVPPPSHISNGTDRSINVNGLHWFNVSNSMDLSTRLLPRYKCLRLNR